MVAVVVVVVVVGVCHVLLLLIQHNVMTTEIWVAHQFVDKLGDAEAAKTSRQCLRLLLAEMCNGCTALGIKSSFSRMLHYQQWMHETTITAKFTASKCTVIITYCDLITLVFKSLILTFFDDTMTIQRPFKKLTKQYCYSSNCKWQVAYDRL